MKHSIRLVETRGSKREVRKLGIVSERLTLGRGTDQNIQIPDRRVPLEHSTLTLKDNLVDIKAKGAITFTVNDHASRRAELHPGDVADIAGDGATQSYTLTVNAINDNPDAADDTAAGDEDNDISGDVSLNDSDLDATNGDATPIEHYTLSVEEISSVSHGSLTLELKSINLALLCFSLNFLKN